MRRFRYWLIRKLAGTDTTILNATTGPVVAKEGTHLTHLYYFDEQVRRYLPV